MARRVSGEVRVLGFNAVRAVLARRADDVMKLYLTEERLDDVREGLGHLARLRRGYEVVEPAELDRIADSVHHEGLVAWVREARPADPAAILDTRGPAAVLVMEGVSNPHNVGAMLRTAAHFGARLAMTNDPRGLTGAARRTAEGGAEWVEIATYGDLDAVLDSFEATGFEVVATSSHAKESLWSRSMPARMVLLVGAEGAGLSENALARAARVVAIPGTGHVESLNVGVATALVLGEWWRKHAVRTTTRAPPRRGKRRS
ncbi:MAG: rRNA methyltransferase [Deltaproteobacteria bacterium]|nr:rRNA methyltransferase [Deltaproteobacteria bacterium]